MSGDILPTMEKQEKKGPLKVEMQTGITLRLLGGFGLTRQGKSEVRTGSYPPLDVNLPHPADIKCSPYYEEKTYIRTHAHIYIYIYI